MEITFDNALFAIHLHNERTLMRLIGIRAAAKEIGISYATLSRLENESMPDTLTYAKCCLWLGEPYDKFIKTKKKK